MSKTLPSAALGLASGSKTPTYTSSSNSDCNSFSNNNRRTTTTNKTDRKTLPTLRIANLPSRPAFPLRPRRHRMLR